MKKDFLFVLLMFAECWIINSQFLPKYYHTRIECSGSLTCVAPFCYLSTYRNFESTINVGCTLVRPLTKVFVQQTTKERYGILYNYQPIMISQPYEWCQIMQDAQFNPIYKLLVQAVSNSVPELFHPCPYWGITNAYNMTLNMDKVFGFFKPGDYSNTLHIFDDLDSSIFKIKVYTTVR